MFNSQYNKDKCIIYCLHYLSFKQCFHWRYTIVPKNIMYIYSVHVTQTYMPLFFAEYRNISSKSEIKKL